VGSRRTPLRLRATRHATGNVFATARGPGIVAVWNLSIDEELLAPAFGSVFDPRWIRRGYIMSILRKFIFANRLSGHLVGNQVNAKVDPYEGVPPSSGDCRVRWVFRCDSCNDRFWRPLSIGSASRISGTAVHAQALAITACCFSGQARAFVRSISFPQKQSAAVVAMKRPV